MNKKKIAWVTDSTAFIPKDLLDNPDVYVVPLEIIFGEDAYEDGVNLTTDQLYSRIKQQKDIPKTSQPSAGKFAQLYEQLKEEYETAIAIHISAKLSGTMESSASGSKITQFEVELVDSKCMSYAITTLIYKGMDLAKQGLPAKEIAAQLREETAKVENYILLGSLEQFYKGGRMSGTQYLLGSMLQIRPIIRINTQGEFGLFEKVRTEKKAIARILDLLAKSYVRHSINQVQIMHGNVLEKALDLKEKIRSTFPDLDIVIGEISSTIAVHAGEGTLATIWHNEPKS